jgi:dihydroxyacetone kinase
MRKHGAVAEQLSAAAAAALGGAERTCTMMPRLGRSSYLRNRAIGHPDPGAHAVAIWLQAVSQSISASR